MKLVRYLINATLFRSKDEKQPNGAVIKIFEELETYRVIRRTLNDEVSATIYGSNIDKMLSISTPLSDLENYLMPKVSNKEDNVSGYYIQIEDTKYKINAVHEKNVIIERIQ